MAIPPSDALWNAAAKLSQLLLHEESVNTTLQRVSTLAATLIETADEVGVTVLHDGRPGTDAATGGVVYEIDDFQYDIDQGPCLHALTSCEVVEIPSMRSEQRWPTYAAFAAERGVNSSLSIPMIIRSSPSLGAPVVSDPAIGSAVRNGCVGVMNLYSRREGPFHDEERWAGITFAEQAAVALYNARTYESAHALTRDLQAALGSRAVIEQAKGLLMGQSRISADDAFLELRRRSQEANRKLRDIAQQIIEDANGAASSGSRATG